MFLQFNFFNHYRIYSGVAQLVEQATVNRCQLGSSPVAGAKSYENFYKWYSWISWKSLADQFISDGHKSLDVIA